VIASREAAQAELRDAQATHEKAAERVSKAETAVAALAASTTITVAVPWKPFMQWQKRTLSTATALTPVWRARIVEALE
jgi:hypothetical protein